MPKLTALMSNSVGKKLISGLTGIALSIFVMEHLFGNLLLLNNNPDPFNNYTQFLTNFGWILYVVELGLIAVFVLHIITGISVFISKKKARPVTYNMVKSAGGTSRKSLSSTTMIYTGIIILVFIFIHLKTFKYGPGVEDGYTTILNGETARDLHRLTMEVFSNELYVIGYVTVMILLGLHLRHGFWSAFQSLGMNHPRYTPLIYGAGYIFAILIAVGFLFLPIWIYFMGGAT